MNLSHFKSIFHYLLLIFVGWVILGAFYYFPDTISERSQNIVSNLVNWRTSYNSSPNKSSKLPLASFLPPKLKRVRPPGIVVKFLGGLGNQLFRYAHSYPNSYALARRLNLSEPSRAGQTA